MTDRRGSPLDYGSESVVRLESALLAAAERSGAGVAEVLFPRTLLNRIPPMYIADVTGKFTLLSPEFEEFLSAAFGAKRDEDGSLYAPDELLGVFRHLEKSVTEVKLRQTVEIGSNTKHYRSFHVRTSENGVQTGYAGIYTDVTLEAEAVIGAARTEARFQDIIRSASDWVWETDVDLNLTYVSSRISETLEVPPGSLIGRNIFALGVFENSSDGLRGKPDLVEARAAFRGRIFLIADNRNRVRRISLSGVPIYQDATGDFVGYRGTGSDVTNEHDAIQSARRSQRELETSLQDLRDRNVQLDFALDEARLAVTAKTEFLCKMSHELRTPLNAIIGFSEISERKMFGELDAHYLSYFQDIKGAAYHLLHIINDILDAVHLESRSLQLYPQAVDLAELVAQARSYVSVRAEDADLDISALTCPAGIVIEADPDRTRQILVNLLNNSVKFTETGGSVGITVLAAPGEYVDITVWDTGVGIPADQQVRIFESFHQAGAGLMSSPRDGTGLGLTISRQLARMMGGDVTVESKPGQGSRFTLRLLKSSNAAETDET
jgi:signal transduction histidine kinase